MVGVYIGDILGLPKSGYLGCKAFGVSLTTRRYEYPNRALSIEHRISDDMYVEAIAPSWVNIISINKPSLYRDSMHYLCEACRVCSILGIRAISLECGSINPLYENRLSAYRNACSFLSEVMRNSCGVRILLSFDRWGYDISHPGDIELVYQLHKDIGVGLVFNNVNLFVSGYSLGMEALGEYIRACESFHVGPVFSDMLFGGHTEPRFGSLTESRVEALRCLGIFLSMYGSDKPILLRYPKLESCMNDMRFLEGLVYGVG